MENAETILVIILSSFLAIFLLLSIVAIIKAIQVLNHLKHIAESAETIADKAEAVGDFFSKTAGPVAIANFLASIAAVVSKKKSKNKG